MTLKHRATSQTLTVVKIGLTIGGWILVVVYVHQQAHTYQLGIVEVLNSPVLQIAATTILLTGLVYLVTFSLPFLPNLGLRGTGMVFFWVTLIVLGHSLAHMGFHDAQSWLLTMREDLGPAAFVLLVLVYGLVLAIPFLPGVELGLLIMAVFGPVGALAAYAATLFGLMLAYAVGQALPERVIVTLLTRIGIALPDDGIAPAMEGMMTARGSNRSVPHRVTASVLYHRYLTLTVCLNFPGNTAVGGGGGLALLCGLSRQFSWHAFFLTVAIATSPIPTLVLTGLLNVEPLMQHHGFLHDALTQIEGLFMHH